MTAGLLTLTECIALMLAAIVTLTIAGVNIGGLLLPAAVGLAFASKDVLQNLVAGGRSASVWAEGAAFYGASYAPSMGVG